MGKIKKKKTVEQSVLELARERIKRAYDLHDHVAVAFSGGKDSTVVLELALQEAEERGLLPLDVIHYDEEAIPYQTEEYVRRRWNDPRINMRWYCISLKHRNAASHSEPYWYPWDPRCPEKWVREMPPEAVRDEDVPGFMPNSFLPQELNGLAFPRDEYGTVGLMLGLRADESMMRMRASLKSLKDNFISRAPRGLAHCPFCVKQRAKRCLKHAPDVNHINTVSPIYDWRTADVWTAPKIFGWDYNTSYDAMDKAGISPSMQRVAPPFGEEPLGGLWMFKVCFPEIWPKMTDRVSGAATAARYANTSLYGWGHIDKPTDMTWQEYIRHILERYPPKERVKVAETIQSTIQLHISKTTDPIVSQAPHPLSGVSWKLLSKMAIRGNMKGRAAPPLLNDDPRARARYEAEREAEENAK